MTEHHDACTEFEQAARLSRRRFMAGVAATGATAVTTNLFGDAVRQASFGAGTTGGNVMVVVSCRGGLDGLGLVVPHGDPAYAAARPTIAVPRNQLVCSDGMFGLAPSLRPLQWLWDSGEMAAVQAVGMPQPNRSHFAAMEAIEDSDPGSSARTGWVNRMAGLDGPASDIIHMGSPIPPTIIDGPAASLAAGGLDEIELSGTSNGWKRQRRRQLSTGWSADTGPLGRAARSALSTVNHLEPVAKARYSPGATYPSQMPAKDLGDALRDSAQLIKADAGVEVITIDFGSWDMHANYGTLTSGQMQKMGSALGDGLNAFMRDLGALRSKVTVVTISEFGRRVAENGNRGLDHGWGNMMLVLGAGVRGGRYYGTWPGLSSGSLVDGDLKITTDYRQVLGEIVHKRFPAKDVTQVFPGVSYAPLGLLSA